MADALLKTPLHDWHAAHGGRMVEFGGWAMPVQYSTIIEEHGVVRNRVGLFDISHMGRLKYEGPDAAAWIDRVATNSVARLAPGQIQYSLLTNEVGGTLDDILVYRVADAYRVVCNASNRAKVVDQFERHRGGFEARLVDVSQRTAMIAVQGPAAVAVAGRVFDAPLGGVAYYHAVEGTARGVACLASRTGYTGEDGFELIVPEEAAVSLWEALLDVGRAEGIAPCGLGARDTLRFEAAMPLYGHELDETINPYEAGLGWAVKLAKGDFVGRAALERLKRQPGRRRVGLALEGKRIARQGAVVLRDGAPAGLVTSGTFAPTLGRSLAMALVEPEAAASEARLVVDVRGRAEPAAVVPLPFYRRA